MSTPPVVVPSTDFPPTEQRVVGILLAAGQSERYGSANKLLERVGGERVVSRALEPMRSAPLDTVCCVVGYQAKRVRAALPATQCHYNDAWQDGMGTSVALGARQAAGNDADAVIFALGDMPWVAPGSVQALLAAYDDGAGSALAAAYRGHRGNPVLFDRVHFDELTALDGTDGGRSVFQACDDAALVETGDPGVRRDVDRQADLS